MVRNGFRPSTAGPGKSSSTPKVLRYAPPSVMERVASSLKFPTLKEIGEPQKSVGSGLGGLWRTPPDLSPAPQG